MTEVMVKSMIGGKSFVTFGGAAGCQDIEHKLVEEFMENDETTANQVYRNLLTLRSNINASEEVFTITILCLLYENAE